MKKLLSLFTSSILIFACADVTNPGSINRYFYANSELSSPQENVGMYVNWTAGDKIAFKFELIHPDEINIADDELTEIFWIEIPSGITEFSKTHLMDSEVEVYYVRSCFCGFTIFEFSEYEVEGERLNNGTWQVSFKMTAKSDSYDHEFTLEDSGTYSLGQRE
ncbi:MAG TPA: hypothetical protein VIN11_08965 [Roseivirga sp.]